MTNPETHPELYGAAECDTCHVPLVVKHLTLDPLCAECADREAHVRCGMAEEQSKAVGFDFDFPPLPFRSMLVWAYTDAPAALRELHPTKEPHTLLVVYVPAGHQTFEEARPVSWLKTRMEYPLDGGARAFVGYA